MITSFVHKYLIKKYYVIEVNILENGEEYNVVYLKKRGTVIKILEQESTKDFETLLHIIKKNIPLILSFTGKKIVSKTVLNQTNYLETVLFNKDPNDFYIYEYFLDNSVLISIARKDVINFYLEKFQKLKYGVMDFSIGLFILEAIRPLIPEQKVISTKNFTYTFNPPNLDFSNNSSITHSNYYIGDENIKNQNIVSFSGFMAHLNTEVVSTNFKYLTNKNKEEILYRRAFHLFGSSILGLFLILLSVSYLTKSIYADKSAEILQELNVKEQQISDIKTLTKDKEYKENIIQNSSLATSDFLTFYISEITNNLPKEIILEEINLFPAKYPINEDKKIDITSRKIIIAGVTDSKSSVNDWMALLNDYQWIKKTELVSYLFIKNEYKFTLNLFL